MTREEAIRSIETVFQDEYVYKYYDSITHQALNMAIEALSADTVSFETQVESTRQVLDNFAKDRVKVVRCKDCKYRDPEDERCDHGAVNFLLRRTDNDYCSYGERKGGEDE